MKQTKGCVYLLEDYRNDERAFKIGFTTGLVKNRVKTLQTGNSATILIVAEFRTNNYLKLEKMLHRNYNKYHKRGEWFELCDITASQFISECEKFDDIINFLNENNCFY